MGAVPISLWVQLAKEGVVALPLLILVYYNIL